MEEDEVLEEDDVRNGAGEPGKPFHGLLEYLEQSTLKTMCMSSIWNKGIGVKDWRLEKSECPRLAPEDKCKLETCQ